MLKNTAFALCLALTPMTLSCCSFFQSDVRVDQVQVKADTFLPVAHDICAYLMERSPDPVLESILDLLSDPEAKIRVARLEPMLDWILPLYVGEIDSDPTLSLNAKEGRKLAARALETSLKRILGRE